MSPVSSNDAELKGVLNTIGLRLATQTCKADPVIDALCTVFVSNVENNRFLSKDVQQPRSAFSELRRTS